MLYRINQFIKAVFGKVTEDEVQFVNQYLNKEEQKLFYKLKVYEQRHCIDVAIKLKELTQANHEMIRLGLLHDIGKSLYPLNPFEKAMIVVLDRLSRGKIRKYKQLKMVKCYYEHPSLGYAMLKTVDDYDESFLQIIRQHHLKESENEKLKVLQKADDLS